MRIMGHSHRKLRFRMWIVAVASVWLQTGVVHGAVCAQLLKERIEKINADVRELAAEVETLYQKRCNQEGTQDCARGTYHSCLSKLLHPRCNPEGEAFHNSDCGDKSQCSTTYSFASSTILLNNDLTTNDENRTPLNTEATESICFTNDLDKFFVEKWNASKADDNVILPFGMYFGSRTGVFRRFPGMRYSDEACDGYDPRVRPWYVAASSGPRNVVLLLDTSNSMNYQGSRKVWLKNAAKLTIQTLNKNDRIAILTVSDETMNITEGMQGGSSANKQTFQGLIENITFGGGKNWNNAFQKAFDILDESAANYDARGCPVSIMVLTDTARTDFNRSQIYEGLNQTKSSLKLPIYLFSYVFNETIDTPDYDEFRDLVCSVPDSFLIEVDSNSWKSTMIANFEVFALRLGAELPVAVAVVEPYPYADMPINGTTISAPVYDRSGGTPMFLGVVGIDLTMPTLLEGTDATEEDFITCFVDESETQCVELQECELESFLRQNDPGQCLVNNNCTESDNVSITERRCNYSEQLWSNMYYMNVSYKEAACCNVQTKEVLESTCPAGIANSGDASLKIILPTVLLGLLCAVLAGGALIRIRQRPRSQDDPDHNGVLRQIPIVIPPPFNPAASDHLASAPFEAEYHKDPEHHKDIGNVDEDCPSSIPPSSAASVNMESSRVANVPPESAQLEALDDELRGPQ